MADFRQLAQKMGLMEEELMNPDKSHRKELFEKFFSSPQQKGNLYRMKVLRP